MKRFWAIVLVSILCVMIFSSCAKDNAKQNELISMTGSTLQGTHEIEGIQFETTYTTEEYDLGQWRITDSKSLTVTAEVTNVPEGATILLENVHVDVVVKSENQAIDNLVQDESDDFYHGTSQDGILITEEYGYQKKFNIEAYSKNLIERWRFVCTSGFVTQSKLTEEHLVKHGSIYANEIQIVYDVLIKYANEEFYHRVSLVDEFLIPVGND